MNNHNQGPGHDSVHKTLQPGTYYYSSFVLLIVLSSYEGLLLCVETFPSLRERKVCVDYAYELETKDFHPRSILLNVK